MKCFYHQDRDAVGICKSCGRGLCPECAVDLKTGLACKGRCEDEARALIGLIQTNIQSAHKVKALLRKSRSAGLALAALYIALGIVFLAWGLTSEGVQFTAIIGALFGIYGIHCAVSAFTTPKDRGDGGTTPPGPATDKNDRAA